VNPRRRWRDGVRFTGPAGHDGPVKRTKTLEDYSVMSEDATKTGLNAIGKPYSTSYDPNYRLKHKVSYRHLRWPYPTTMRFVGDHPNYNPNLRCFRGDPWWTQLHETAQLRETQRRKQQFESEENATATLSWKENARNGELTARAPAGSYILSPFLHCWNVDYRKKEGRRSRGTRLQLGFARTLDEAKAIAHAARETAA